ncbi:MAG: hypothetical protein V3S64_05805, partial [bacterium]
MENITETITGFTPEQEALLEAFRQEWLGIGACTDPADRPRAEWAIALLYWELKKKAPEFVWCASPMTFQYEIHQREPGPKLDRHLWKTLGNHAKSRIHIAAAGTARENLSTQIWSQISARLEDPLYDALGGGLANVIEGQLEHDLKEN